MTPIERDEVLHCLQSLTGFYGKAIDKPALSFWLKALSGCSADEIKRAADEYVKTGKYTPKPVDLIELIRIGRQHHGAHQDHPRRPATPCPPEIAKAWAWFIKLHSGYDFGAKGHVTPEDQEKYLLIVNEQARAYGQPEAIPEPYRLAEVWANYRHGEHQGRLAV